MAKSRAYPSPTIAGKRTVPPSMSGTPNRLNQLIKNFQKNSIPHTNWAIFCYRFNSPKVAFLEAILMSAARASSRPPATQGPSIAAITGFVNFILHGPIGDSSVFIFSSLFIISSSLLLASSFKSFNGWSLYDHFNTHFMILIRNNHLKCTMDHISHPNRSQSKKSHPKSKWFQLWWFCHFQKL